MPIEEIDDYPEKMTEFEMHWGSVNSALGGTPETDFELLGNYTLADFSADKGAVVTALSDQEGLANDLDFARSDRDTMRADLRQKLILFRNTCKAMLPDSRYLRALPDTPGEQSDQQKLLDAWDDMAHIWQQINTDQPAEVAPAMTLRGNYSLAEFQTEVATMRTRYDAVKAAERAAADGRGTRDQLLQAAYDHMVQYRERLPVVLEPDDPLLSSMPQISPSSGGPTEPPPPPPPPPADLTLSGFWDSATVEAALSWTASTDPNLADYELRMSPGASYDPSTSMVVNSFPSDTDPLEFRTTQGLENSGDVASFKIFARDVGGGETGSNTVTITRP